MKVILLIMAVLSLMVITGCETGGIDKELEQAKLIYDGKTYIITPSPAAVSPKTIDQGELKAAVKDYAPDTKYVIITEKGDQYYTNSLIYLSSAEVKITGYTMKAANGIWTTSTAGIVLDRETIKIEQLKK